ncbi:hypothetical protein K439DRAFT_386326 [Ramaria rubella]|nr:hypothetical protein K439DRAFT_386326 [Ramaria rubella]
MPVVLSILRLWILILNLYGTFKAMKPPPLSQRSTRNGQGPSARAMQLRKRELKSRLAVWVVWAMFLTIERPLDGTIGLLVPFYNQLKCLGLIFMLITRSHGAEAIFLHIIHPAIRPYTPAIDDILANLHSVFELLVLLCFLPWEYVSDRWRNWKWSWNWFNKESTHPDTDSPDDSRPGGSEGLIEEPRRLRLRTGSQQSRLREAGRQAQTIFQDIEVAQDRVRTRSRSQHAAPGNVHNRPVPVSGRAESSTGLRTRKRVLEYPRGLPVEAARPPGSRSTGVHHLDSATIAQLAGGPALEQSPMSPPVPNAQPPLRPFPPASIPTPSSSSHSGHEIWYPPQSSYEDHARKSTPPRDFTRRTPSPVYPPLPSAYHFTPRRSEPLPPPPRIVTPSNLPDRTFKKRTFGGAFTTPPRLSPTRTNADGGFFWSSARAVYPSGRYGHGDGDPLDEGRLERERGVYGGRRREHSRTRLFG